MATLKDIAKKSGVSTATVSYVVNNGPKSVMPETRARVLAAIAAMNYHPNAHARGLRGKKTNTIGVVFPHVVHEPFENAYFGPVLGGIIDAATQRKKATMLFTAFDFDEVETCAPSLCDGRCDGFLILAPRRTTRLVGDLQARNVPVVVVGTHPEGAEALTVDADNVKGGHLATRHLIEIGHRRIGIISDGDPRTCSLERLEGYRKALDEAGIEFDPSFVCDIAPYEAGDDELGQWLVARREMITAVFCTQDYIAARAIEAAGQCGLHVPNDLSVVGFDDNICAVTSEPPMTTIRQPMRQIGLRAAEALFDCIDAVDSEPTGILFDVQLIQRASSAPPRGAATATPPE